MTLSTDSEAALLAALAWQVELGVDECISDDPINRFELPKPEPKPAVSPVTQLGAKPPAAGIAPAVDENAEAVTEAQRLAREAQTLEALHAAMTGFEGCSLKRGARNTVFSDGNPAARVMFIGEAPGREEDRAGSPFVGRSGQLLDRMLGAIGLDRRAAEPDKAAYITNVIPWRPVENRDPSTDEAAMMWAFLERHIELAAPEFIVTLGKISAATLLEKPVAITRARGRWHQPARGGGRPVLLTFHPAYLLRQPGEKAKSWRDLLSLRATLDGEAPTIEK
ncbi:MAG: uracil-DNA glycosylase [Pikeienuella sp.]